MSDLTCPVCKSGYVQAIENGSGYNCAVCGPYLISSTAQTIQSNKDNNPLLSAWIRSHQENSQPIPNLTTYIIDEILESLVQYSVLEKQLFLLRAIERRSDYPGKEISLDPDCDYPLAFAKNSEELNFLCRSLKARGMLAFNDDLLDCGEILAQITTFGWEYLDSQANKPLFSDQVFVAMSFDKTMNDAWKQGIKPAIEEAGYKAHRIDQEHHIDRIDAKIISDIKDSLFVVADVTQQKQGVYFEAGYAIGLNRPVIWCVRQDELEKVHFDTRQYNHIVWETPEQLKEQLYYRICAVIGKRAK